VKDRVQFGDEDERVHLAPPGLTLTEPISSSDILTNIALSVRELIDLQQRQLYRLDGVDEQENLSSV
jgi:hypothetical protein